MGQPRPTSLEDDMPLPACYDADTTLSPAAAGNPALRAEVGPGPQISYTGVAGMGFASTHAVRFTGDAAAAESDVQRVVLHDVSADDPAATLASDTVLRWVGSFDLDAGQTYAGGYACLDLVFTDGSRLSELRDADGNAPTDQLGFPMSPAGQGESKAHYPHQWNYREVSAGRFASGRHVASVELAWQPVVDDEGTGVDVSGYVDAIALSVQALPSGDVRRVDRVITTRGTNASGTFSRGNNIPATAVPNGFAFFTPCTDARSLRWVYSYAGHNDDQNRSRLQALSVSHQPSPWMGDRLTFQVMPQSTAIAPTADPNARSLAFSHRDELARPHHYSVTLEDGTLAELAPTDHTVVIRVTFPDGTGRLVFDNADDQAKAAVDADGVLTGWSDSIPGPRGDGAGRMFVYGYAVNATPTGHGRLSDGAGTNTAAFVEYGDADTGPLTVTFHLATSFLSVEQARHNLELEVGRRGAERSFDAVAGAAAEAWDDRLNVLTISGANVDDEALTTLYSNLYRLNLFPNSGHENTGTAENPDWRHASPGLPPEREPDDTTTGSVVVPGKIYVNNGFWDTYRTAWPAYSLLYPEFAGELVDGFVQHYREAGWIPRWSSPGFADCMVGTSSDVAFADALVKGVENFDVAAAYDSAVKNASVATDDTRVGRKSLDRSLFLGYTPIEEPEGLSWSIDGYINDFGIAAMAAWLLAREHDHAVRGRLADELAWFGDRARGYVRLFAADRGFFHGRSVDGSWRQRADQFDPDVWGEDYTETNAWNMAFTVPHDGAGLAGVHGGREQLAAKLEEFFTRPERAREANKGAYRHVIHEMTEARDVRMGMFGHSNQPAHHIPFMWLHAGRPERCQEVVREIMSRFHAGSQIGQGYAGDEDNGEMSAWHLFATLGIYPTAVGSPHYSIGSPLYGSVTMRRPGHQELVVRAESQSRKAIHVSGLSIDGKPHERAFVSHDELSAASEFLFTMSEAPATWGSADEAIPPSMSEVVKVPDVLDDITADTSVSGPDNVDVSVLTDDRSSTSVLLSPGASFEFSLPDVQPPALVEMYTLTSAPIGPAPSHWRLEVEVEARWLVLDERSDEHFRWPRQTRPFRTSTRVAGRRFRLTFTDQAIAAAQVELLARGRRVVPD
jgi:predicted alpha-1,2-mannosidase